MKLIFVLLVLACAWSMTTGNKGELKQVIKNILHLLQKQKQSNKKTALDEAVDNNLKKTLTDLANLKKALNKDATASDISWQTMLQQRYVENGGYDYDGGYEYSGYEYSGYEYSGYEYGGNGEDGNSGNGNSGDGNSGDGGGGNGGGGSGGNGGGGSGGNGNGGGGSGDNIPTTDCSTLNNDVPWVNEAMCGKKQVTKSTNKANLLFKLRSILRQMDTQKATHAKIVSGTVTEAHQFPWTVGLVESGEVVCGGSLITENWVLTAAHCWDGASVTPPFTTKVVIGEHDTTTNEDRAAEHDIQKVIIHADYDKPKDSVMHDIMLIKLSTPADVAGNHVNPICLNNKDVTAGTDGIVTGWGITANGVEAGSEKLRSASLEILDKSECGEQLQCTQICAKGKGSASTVADSCQGDSGGPLFVVENDVSYQVGIVSYGGECGDPNNPGVYTYVPKYLGWIYNHINNN